MVLSQQVVKDQELKKEANMKMEQGSEKKVPLLTISLRPGNLRTYGTASNAMEKLFLKIRSSFRIWKYQKSAGGTRRLPKNRLVI